MTEAKFGNDLPISFDVGSFHVREQASALPDHLQQALTAVMVLCMRPEVLGEVVDAIREDGNLNFCRPGVGFVGPVLRDRRCFFECHGVIFSVRAAGAVVPRIVCSIGTYSICHPL